MTDFISTYHNLSKMQHQYFHFSLKALLLQSHVLWIVNCKPDFMLTNKNFAMYMKNAASKMMYD